MLKHYTVSLITSDGSKVVYSGFSHTIAERIAHRERLQLKVVGADLRKRPARVQMVIEEGDWEHASVELARALGAPAGADLFNPSLHWTPSGPDRSERYRVALEEAMAAFEDLDDALGKTGAVDQRARLSQIFDALKADVTPSE